jgi:glutathionyl-hydroquinone reductase
VLVNGRWTAEWHPVRATDVKGAFVRQISSFRHWVTPDDSPGPTCQGGFKAEAGRYHLYVAPSGIVPLGPSMESREACTWGMADGAWSEAAP